MIDPNFFSRNRKELRLGEVITRTGARPVPESAPASMELRGLASFRNALDDELTFWTGKKRDSLPPSASQCGACFVKAGEPLPSVGAHSILLEVSDPKHAWCKIAGDWLAEKEEPATPDHEIPDMEARIGTDCRIRKSAILGLEAWIGAGCVIEANAIIGHGAIIEAGTRIAPGAIIGARAQIGRNCRIDSLVSVGPDVYIGDDTRIEAHVSLYHCRVGRRVHIRHGASIGSRGFGFAKMDGEIRPVPHFGRVIIHDDVEIGTNNTINRGTIDDTVIGPNCGLDSLILIGHNCVLCGHIFIVGSTAIGGSVWVERGVRISGQVAISDHLRIGARTEVGGNATITKSTIADTQVMGTPAQPVRDFQRQVLWIKKSVEREKNERQSRHKGN